MVVYVFEYEFVYEMIVLKRIKNYIKKKQKLFCFIIMLTVIIFFDIYYAQQDFKAKTTAIKKVEKNINKIEHIRQTYNFTYKKRLKNFFF